MNQCNSSFSLSQEHKDGFLLSNLTLRVVDLPNSLHGLRALHLSDLHYGALTSDEHIKKMLTICNEFSADICFITGDFIQLHANEFYHYLSTKVDPQRFKRKQHLRKLKDVSKYLNSLLREISTKHGHYYCLGNHDYLEGASTLKRQLQGTWLVNDCVDVQIGESRITIAAVDDHRYGNHNLKLTSKTTLTHKGELKILLAHNPDISLDADKAELRHYDLILSGHTHGGQICLPGGTPIVTQTKQRRYVKSGPHPIEQSQIYISSGIGYSGLPFRLFCPPEIVQITFEKA